MDRPVRGGHDGVSPFAPRLGQDFDLVHWVLGELVVGRLPPRKLQVPINRRSVNAVKDMNTTGGCALPVAARCEPAPQVAEAGQLEQFDEGLPQPF
jgi:hypothetical protein